MLMHPILFCKKRGRGVGRRKGCKRGVVVGWGWWEKMEGR
jgi:hypothetical protein